MSKSTVLEQTYIKSQVNLTKTKMLDTNSSLKVYNSLPDALEVTADNCINERTYDFEEKALY